MDIIWDGIKNAAVLIFTGDGEIYEILFTTLKFSGIAVLLSILL